MQNNEHKSTVADMLSDWKGYGPDILKQPGENTGYVIALAHNIRVKVHLQYLFMIQVTIKQRRVIYFPKILITFTPKIDSQTTRSGTPWGGGGGGGGHLL